MARSAVCFSTLALVLGQACQSADRPADPAWGRQACAHCGMVLGEPRTAAEMVTTDGARLYFDDIGCMLVYEHDTGARTRYAWVHDANGSSWIDAEHAAYAGGELTPMDFGFVAHAVGPGQSLDDVRARVLARRDEAGKGSEHGTP